MIYVYVNIYVYVYVYVYDFQISRNLMGSISWEKRKKEKLQVYLP